MTEGSRTLAAPSLRGLRLAGLALVALLVGGGLWLGGVLADGEVAPWNRLVAWLLEQQRLFHRELTAALGELRSAEPEAAWLAAGGLIAASFLYGVFHAAGPGHGKAIIATYLLTQDQRVRRGVTLAALAAFCQGLVALLLVYGLVGLAGWLPRETGAAVTWSERTSYLLVAAVGLFLSLRALRGAWRSRRAGGGGDHSHTHDHEHGSCGHSHGPSAEEIARAGDWRSGLGIVLSIGLRPCSGAVVVLVFARAVELGWAGVAAVGAMSLGTALATSLLAWLAVHARELARRLADARPGWSAVRLARLGSAVSLLGGLVILALGISLFSASFQPVHPLGLG